MSNTVRMAFEFTVEKGSPDEIAIALHKAKEEIIGFATDSILPEDDEAGGAIKVVKGGAEVHLHEQDSACNTCYRQHDRDLYV